MNLLMRCPALLHITSFVISEAWQEAAKPLGLSYSNDKVYLTDTEFALLPSIQIILLGDSTYGKDVEWMIRPESYYEPLAGQTKKVMLRGANFARKDERFRWTGRRYYTNRIYLNEAAGAVLGANSMIDHHFLFDVGNHRVGIAPADCSEFDDVVHAS